MSRSVRVAIVLITAWIGWMLVKIPLGNGYEALGLGAAFAVLGWLITGIIADRLAAPDAVDYDDEDEE